jgi:hypothetical protein
MNFDTSPKFIKITPFSPFGSKIYLWSSYSYELLPEYENGEKKLPCVKAMNWEGKT